MHGDLIGAGMQEGILRLVRGLITLGGFVIPGHLHYCDEIVPFWLVVEANNFQFGS